MNNRITAIKYNNQIVQLLRNSSISNDELMAITRKLDKLTSLALRAAKDDPNIPDANDDWLIFSKD